MSEEREKRGKDSICLVLDFLVFIYIYIYKF